MDAFLDQAWRSGVAPFHGVTIEPTDSLPLSELRKALDLTADWLERTHHPHNLLALDDWHNHDGFIKASEPTTWEQVRATFSEDQRLRDSATGDFQVFRATYPPTAEWLLRWYLDDEDLDRTGGEFTISIGLDVISGALEESLRQIKPIQVNPSASWFARLYSG